MNSKKGTVKTDAEEVKELFQLKVETKDFDIINVEVIIVRKLALKKTLRWIMAACWSAVAIAAVWVTRDGGIAAFVEHLGR